MLLSNQRVKELIRGHGYIVDPSIIKLLYAAIEEAVAENDKAWQWQLRNPESVAYRAKAAYVKEAIKESVAEEREILEYIYGQTLGDKLKSRFKDGDMKKVFLQVGMLRRLAAVLGHGRPK